jgi:hypothetical protein
MVINSVVKIPIRPDGLIEKGGMYLLVGSFCGLTGTAVGLISVAAVWGAAGAGFTALSIGDPILAVFWLVVSILLVPPALAATVAAFVFPWTITHE